MSRSALPIVLASKSIARTQVLAGAGVRFVAVDAGVDEGVIKHGLLGRGATPHEVARVLAEEKAKAASLQHEGLVIGADQTLDFRGRLFDKAQSLAEARTRLIALRGEPHQLHAGLAVAVAGEIIMSRVDSATLVMRDFSDVWLDGYLARNVEALLGSVGCYLLEGEGVQLFERIDGDYFTILGLPLLPLLHFLRKEGALAE